MNDTWEKIQGFWRVLDDKQQLYAVLSTVALALLLLSLLVYLPLLQERQRLSSQLVTQQLVTEKLMRAQTMPTHFITIERKTLKSTIANIIQQKKLQANIDLQGRDTLVLTLKDQPFQALTELLLLLRNQYAITTTKASFLKTKDGFVNATLTLSIP